MAPILARMWLAWLGFATLGEQLAGCTPGLQELNPPASAGRSKPPSTFIA